MHELPSIASELIAVSGADLANAEKVRIAAQTMEALLLHEPAKPDDRLSMLGQAEITRLQQIYERYETDLEYEYADRIIRGEATLEQYPLYQRFRRLIQAEIDLADINESDRVLFIGSGPLPISPILIAQLGQVSVDCFDHSKQACDTSQLVINSLGLTDRINIFNASGDTQRIFTYSAIMVALLAQPKSGILHNIQISLPEGTPVICRTSEGDRAAFYKPTSPEIYRSTRYQLAGKHQAGAGETVTSLLLKIHGPRENR